jgi:hypothetical protein
MTLQSTSYQAPGFDSENPRGHSMHWRIQDGLFSFGLTNTQHELMYLEEYEITQPSVDELRGIVSDNPFLCRNIWKDISLVIANQSFTHLPTELYRKEYTARYLQLAKGKVMSPNESISTQTEGNIVTVFSIEKSILDYLSDLYAFHTPHIQHLTTVLIRKALSNTDTSLRGIMYLEANAFTFLLSNGSELLFCNRFAFITPQDLAYYLLFVIAETKINPADVTLELLGQVNFYDENYTEIQKYFPQIELGTTSHQSALTGVQNHKLFGIF